MHTSSTKKGRVNSCLGMVPEIMFFPCIYRNGNHYEWARNLLTTSTISPTKASKPIDHHCIICPCLFCVSGINRMPSYCGSLLLCTSRQLRAYTHDEFYYHIMSSHTDILMVPIHWPKPMVQKISGKGSRALSWVMLSLSHTKVYLDIIPSVL